MGSVEFAANKQAEISSFMKILVVDDEASIREMVRFTLELDGHSCLEASSAQEALPIIVDSRPDLILLDWMMPNVSGLELLRRLRRDDQTREIPVVMLTAKTEENSAVNALDAGADDYIIKPFRGKELVSRIKAILRRSSPEDTDNLVVENLELDPIGHRVFVEEKPIKIGPTEYNLLKFFLTHQERAYTRGQLLDQVWGGNVYVEERTVDVHIRRLRSALNSASEKDYGAYIQTVRGTGYRFSKKTPFM